MKQRTRSTKLAFFPTVLLAVVADAQLPIVPARTVEETRVPVFAAFQPRAEEQTVEHPVVLANFRLRVEYRLPTADARLAVRVHPSATVALPVGKAGAWRVLDLQYEQVVGKASALVAEVDRKVVADVPAIAKSKSAQLTEQLTFPDGIAGVPTHLALIASGGAEKVGASEVSKPNGTRELKGGVEVTYHWGADFHANVILAY